MAKIEGFQTYHLSISFERPLRTGIHTYSTLDRPGLGFVFSWETIARYGFH